MDTQAITNLSKLLRNNESSTITGESKFSVTVDLLNHLNTLFSSVIESRDCINASFSVVANRASSLKLEMFGDLQYLYQFVQRIPSLKLTAEVEESDKYVNVSRFKLIRLLHLQAVRAHRVTGIRQVRPFLQYLICMRSVESLAEILERCGGDQCSGFVWSELREAVFSYNGLTEVDGSLKFTPWLLTLDVSHNLLTDIAHINDLDNMKHLNVGYNRLTKAPMFSPTVCSCLQVLVLRSNCIEDITYLALITNLRELDLADNYLMEHRQLAPIAALANLQTLSLDGNPLSYHPQHRARTFMHLHRNTVTVHFVLDCAAASKQEKLLVGSVHPLLRAAQSPVVSGAGTGDEQRKRTRRRPKGRDAVISDDETEDENNLTSSVATSFCSLALASTDEHLETKRQIEHLREQYGDKWLQAQAGSMVQEALGMEVTPMPMTSTPYASDFLIHAADVQHTPILSSSPALPSQMQRNNDTTIKTYLTASETLGTVYHSLIDNDSIRGSNASLRLSPTPSSKHDSADVSGNSPTESTPTAVVADQDISSPPECVSPTSDNSLDNVQIVDSDVEADAADLEVSEENVHLVSCVTTDTIKNVATKKYTDVFLTITATHLIERDCCTLRERARWSQSSLTRCLYASTAKKGVADSTVTSTVNVGVIILEFDTLRMDRQRREYECEHEPEKLNHTLQGIVEHNSATQTNRSEKYISYACMKCSSEFQTERSLRVEGQKAHQVVKGGDPGAAAPPKALTCPACKSTLVIRKDS